MSKKLIDKQTNIEGLRPERDKGYFQSYKTLILLTLLFDSFFVLILFYAKSNEYYPNEDYSKFIYQNAAYLRFAFLSFLGLIVEVVLGFKNYTYLVKTGLTRPTRFKSFICRAIPLLGLIAAIIVNIMA